MSAAAQRQPTLADRCREAIELLDKARQEQPRHLSEDVDAAERAIVGLRDDLIDRLRTGGASTDSALWRGALDATNAALSLVVGVEYPAAGIQRRQLEQARDALQSLVDGEKLGA